MWRRVSDLSAEQRRAIEALVGRALSDDEGVNIQPSRVLKDAPTGEERVLAFEQYQRDLDKLAARAGALDWSQCPAVESVPGKLGGAWVFRNSRMPVAAVFENLEDGVTIDELIELYAGLTREQVQAVLDFAARSLITSAPAH